MGLRDCDGDDSSNKKDLENVSRFVENSKGCKLSTIFKWAETSRCFKKMRSLLIVKL